ncbi:MAG: YgiT-type zinc finger protein [Candidatus Riflebacteria bacterium]|nr:YgiT-type zinc finger protein [Candidatus Riflebacteria bacterium]
MRCDLCGCGSFRQGVVSETFRVGGRIVLVEGIPADVCCNCGDETISAAVSERVRQLVREPQEAPRVVMAELLAYKAA